MRPEKAILSHTSLYHPPVHCPCACGLWYSTILMIRKNALFCKLIRIKKSSKVLFESYMASFCPEREACPICGSSGNCHIHAYYGRRIIDFIHGKPVLQEITVLRLVCESCGHTHAVLPDMLIPYSGYGLFFILRVLAEAFLGRSSVEALCERFRITRNQFYQWKQLFSRHKQEWLGMLEHSETSGLDFLLGIARLPEYSLFSGRFAVQTASSFLQSHRNPPAMAGSPASPGLRFPSPPPVFP